MNRCHKKTWEKKCTIVFFSLTKNLEKKFTYHELLKMCHAFLKYQELPEIFRVLHDSVFYVID